MGNVDKLIKKLTDNKAETRKIAAIELGKLGDLQAVEPLITRLKDDDEDVRMWAAASLGKLGDERALEPLVKVVMSDSQRIRKEAARAVVKIVPSFDDVNIDIVIQKIESIYEEFTIDKERELERLERKKEFERKKEEQVEELTQKKVFEQLKEVQEEPEIEEFERSPPLPPEQSTPAEKFPVLDPKYINKKLPFKEGLILQYSKDGKYNIEQISEKCDYPIEEVQEIIDKYEQKGWLRICSPEEIRAIYVRKAEEIRKARTKKPPPPIKAKAVAPAAKVEAKKTDEGEVGVVEFMTALKKHPIDDRVEELSNVMAKAMNLFVNAIDDIATRLTQMENYMEQRFQQLEQRKAGIPTVKPVTTKAPLKKPILKPPARPSGPSTRAALNEELRKVLLKRRVED